jgi:signal transduction histidine kinase
MTGLGQISTAWPLLAPMAAALGARGLRSGRRRTALNEALHELRRPLQVVALSAGPGIASGGGGEDPIEQAAVALERLDREINGAPVKPVWSAVDAWPLVQAAVGRWQARATISESSLELRWNAGRVFVEGDRFALAQALDNLIVNAIEHGGSSIVVAARLRAGGLRIAVADSGSASRPRTRRGSPAAVIALLQGKRRRGHGLAVVRRVTGAHGGRFALRCSERGSLAILELPLAEGDGTVAA